MPDHEKVNIKASSNVFPILPTIMLSARGINKPFNKDNIITLARVTSLTSNPPCVCVSIKESRFSYQQIIESGEFVINFVDSELTYAADWCGVKSGREYDKFKICKLTPVPIEKLSTAPAVLESKLSLGCKLVQTIHMADYGIFIGEIVSVIADKEAVDEKGKLISDQLDYIAFDSVNANYRHVGKNINLYGFSLHQT